MGHHQGTSANMLRTVGSQGASIQHGATRIKCLSSLCEGVRNCCISMMYGMYVCSPVVIPRQLKFSLYSGAVITEGMCSLFTSLL